MASITTGIFDINKQIFDVYDYNLLKKQIFDVNNYDLLKPYPVSNNGQKITLIKNRFTTSTVPIVRPKEAVDFETFSSILKRVKLTNTIEILFSASRKNGHVNVLGITNLSVVDTTDFCYVMKVSGWTDAICMQNISLKDNNIIPNTYNDHFCFLERDIDLALAHAGIGMVQDLADDYFILKESHEFIRENGLKIDDPYKGFILTYSEE